MVAAAAVVVAGVALGATDALLHEAAGAQDPAAARVDAIKTGLSIGAGTGGGVRVAVGGASAVAPGVDRYRCHAGRRGRRITELYTKAVEQPGSDKAPVRLGGLYALERVAQDNPGQRQTIVDVICAYLRMPYDLPGTPPAGEAAREAREDYRDSVQETGPPDRPTHPRHPPAGRPGSRPPRHHVLARHRPGPHRRHLHRLRPDHCRLDTAILDEATFAASPGSTG
jgi:hypothetical protein